MINVTQTFLPPIDEYTSYLQRIWDSKWLTNRGPLVTELEEKLKQYLETNHLLLVNNGTIALQIAIKALDLTGEIITTPFSYVATVSSIFWENCQPVFVDIDENYLTIDETKIEAAITDKTSAILATHVYGNPCNVEAIQKIAEKYNLKVIYDAAHCFGVKYKGESILNWGDISTLSFHATKLFHTGEGGGIVCPDKDLAHKIFYHHNFGHNGSEAFFGLGINAKVSEINAAMGLAVFPYVDQIIARRMELSLLYDELLEHADLQKVVWRSDAQKNFSYYPIVFRTKEKLQKAQALLNENGIFPRRYFYPSLNKLPYVGNTTMTIAESISQRVLCLPLFYELENKDVSAICKIISEIA